MKTSMDSMDIYGLCSSVQKLMISKFLKVIVPWVPEGYFFVVKLQL